MSTISSLINNEQINTFIHNISDNMFRKNDDNVLTIFPLPENKKLSGNNTSITGIYNDNNNPKYNPNGTYIASSSSYADPSNKVFNIFNGTTTNPWKCDFSKNPKYNSNSFSNPPYSQDPYTADTPSTYQGGGQTVTRYETLVGQGPKQISHPGEWIQIQLPYQIYLYQYSLLTPVLPNKINSFPKKFIVVGSNDGNNWSYIHQRELNVLPAQTNSPTVYNVNSIEKYSYFRLLISEVADLQTITSITQWNMKGTLKQTLNKEKFTTMSVDQNSDNAHNGLNYFDINRIGRKEGLSNYNEPTNYIVSGPFDDKILADKCGDNPVFANYQTALNTLRSTYPACKGITKEIINTQTQKSPECAIMSMPGLITSGDTNIGNGCLVLKDSLEQYIILPSIKTTNSGITFSLWFKSNNSKDGAALFYIGNGTDDKMLLSIKNGMLFAMASEKGAYIDGKNVNDNTWRHVAWTMSAGPDNSIGTWTFYINGNMVSSYRNILPPAIVRTGNYVGKSKTDNTFFNGNINEFRIYNSELSQEDITNLYNFPNLPDYDNDYNTTYDIIKRPYLYYSFDPSTIANGTTINNIPGPLVKKSINYTLRANNNLMNFSDTPDSTKKTKKENGDITWIDRVQSWTVAEPFYTIADISNGQIGPINQQSINYSAMLNKINSNYYDISNNISKITNTQGSGLRDVITANADYHYMGGDVDLFNPKPTLKDGIKEDSNTMISQQNSVFILGTICSVALVVGAIVIARE